ncbi:ABC1 kinase family protein [Pelotalea chapellei]|uniref:Ubiquinone biosynthesis protein UbiB n=1 Tax=Pelotalea chapellei TaxID=44671 RepID=A0ABS5UCI2_9BACT|nr:AarF/UbiB family protein [Pelotalea chapellei]MBT1073359.1 ubiquinone biosynthesis protein UbiB [Pelotalea chapellei]
MLSLFKITGNIRNLKRYLNIVRVLSSYGFDQVFVMLGLSEIVERSRRFLKRDASILERFTAAERLRMALEELGPTFIKLGQILSTRSDVIPRAFVLEFEKLQDSVPCFSFEAVKKQIEYELGGPTGNFFSSIEPDALAAASIAQVHRAYLLTGEVVAIKVRRPGVVELVESDISALMGLARLAEKHIPSSDLYDPVGLVREFTRSIRREMDFTREGHTIEKFKSNLLDFKGMYFPKVYWEASARGVLTMEYIDGIKVSDLDALDCASYDRQLLAHRGADVFLEMVLKHGFFHGDPHPGNVLIMPGNVICLLDYGIVGRLDEELKNFLSDILFAIVGRNMDEVVSLLFHAGDVPDSLNTRALKHDLFNFIDGYYEIPLKDVEVGRMLQEFIDLISHYNIRIQPDLMLLTKALVVIEGMGRNLDPNFNMVEHLRPYMERAVRQKYSPGKISKDINSIFSSYVSLARNLPRDLKEIINRINRNKFKIDVEHRGFDRLLNDFDRSMNRLSSSLILSALIIGSSIIMQTDKGPQLLGFPVLAFMGYTVAGVIGLWLVYAIIRSGRL